MSDDWQEIDWVSDAGVHEHRWTNVDPELFENGLLRCITCGFVTEDPAHAIRPGNETVPEWKL